MDRFAGVRGFGIIGGMTDWIEHFQCAAKGLPIAHIWRGHGSALFIEFGELTPMGTRANGTQRPPWGEIGVMVETDWHIEEARTIVCGSGSDKELQETTFARLLGKHFVAITTFGRLPEVLISLSGDFHVASFSTLEGDPQWTLFDKRGPTPISVGCRYGSISRGTQRVC